MYFILSYNISWKIVLHPHPVPGMYCLLCYILCWVSNFCTMYISCNKFSFSGLKFLLYLWKLKNHFGFLWCWHNLRKPNFHLLMSNEIHFPLLEQLRDSMHTSPKSDSHHFLLRYYRDPKQECNYRTTFFPCQIKASALK